MSIAAANPFIDRWTRQGLEWTYLSQQRLAQRTLPPRSMLQLPIDNYTFSYPEGVLLEYTAYFDHPTNVGIRIEQNPNFDTENFYTPANVAIGSGSRPEVQIYALMPPDIPAGFYGVRVCSNWPFIDWMRLHVFNIDSVPHKLIGHAYHIAVVKKKPSIENLFNVENLERIRLALDLLPEKRKELTQKMQPTLDVWLPKAIKKEIKMQEVKD